MVELTPPHQALQIKKLSDFDQVRVIGALDVDLHTDAINPRVQLMGDARDLAKIAIVPRFNTIVIAASKGFPRFGPVKLAIYTSHLNVFHYEGRGRITGERLHSKALDLYIKNPGSTNLSGKLGLRYLRVKGGLIHIQGARAHTLDIQMKDQARIELSGMSSLSYLFLEGQGWLGLRWIRSDYLNVRVREDAVLQLGGAVKMLDVELWQRTRFNGRF